MGKWTNELNGILITAKLTNNYPLPILMLVV